MDFFVLEINQDGEPGRLYGPINWDDAIQKVVSLVKAKTSINQDDIAYIETDGLYKFPDGGGVYIIQPE